MGRFLAAESPKISVQATVRTARIFHALLLVSMLVFAFVGEKAGPAEPRELKIFPQAFALTALLTLVVALLLRIRMVRPAAEMLRRQPEDPLALGRWWAGNLASLALCEAVALCGFVLRMLGGTFLGATPYYAVAILLMLAWTPRLDQSG